MRDVAPHPPTHVSYWRQPRARLNPAAAKSLTTVLLGLVLLGYVWATADPDLLADVRVPLTFQLACWIFGIVVFLCRRPEGVLLGDPHILTMAAAGLYLIYPSIAWVQGQNFEFRQFLGSYMAARLFWIHGLY